MADAPYKSSPSGLRRMKQALEVREKVKSLTEAINSGSPAPAPKPEEPKSEEPKEAPKP